MAHGPGCNWLVVREMIFLLNGGLDKPQSRLDTLAKSHRYMYCRGPMGPSAPVTGLSTGLGRGIPHRKMRGVFLSQWRWFLNLRDFRWPFPRAPHQITSALNLAQGPMGTSVHDTAGTGPRRTGRGRLRATPEAAVKGLLNPG